MQSTSTILPAEALKGLYGDAVPSAMALLAIKDKSIEKALLRKTDDDLLLAALHLVAEFYLEEDRTPRAKLAFKIFEIKKPTRDELLTAFDYVTIGYTGGEPSLAIQLRFNILQIVSNKSGPSEKWLEICAQISELLDTIETELPITPFIPAWYTASLNLRAAIKPFIKPKECEG